MFAINKVFHKFPKKIINPYYIPSIHDNSHTRKYTNSRWPDTIEWAYN